MPALGLWDGKPGTHGDFLLRLPGENDYRSMDAVHYPVPIDSEVIVRTGGGGGWGDPIERRRRGGAHRRDRGTGVAPRPPRKTTVSCSRTI